MSFLNDSMVAIGAFTLAYGAADMRRHYLPNYYRVITPVLLIAAADAYIPQFDFVSWGFQAGLAVAVTGLMWYLRKRQVVRQDGTIDRG